MKYMIEKVARASFSIYCKRNNLDYKFEDMGSEELEFAEEHAIACILALTEPTDEMKMAGSKAVNDCYSLEPGEGFDEDPALAAYEAMIKQALV